MLQPGRQYSAGNQYRYGFNGKENDNEVKGDGNQQDYGMRIFDSRIGRFLSIDPLATDFPWLTPYQFAANKPINSIDLDGLEDMPVYDQGNRKATIGINLIILIDQQTGSDITKAKSQVIHSLFAKGNETFYVDKLPISDGGASIRSNEISKKQFDEGVGYEVTIKYNVTSKVITGKEFKKMYKTEGFNPLYSFLSNEVQTNYFSGDNAAFNSSSSTPNRIKPNTKFFDSYVLHSGNASIEELISHEAGFHNMMGKVHIPDPVTKEAKYPAATIPGLESNTKGMIYPIRSNTLQIMDQAVERGGARREKSFSTMQTIREQGRLAAKEALKMISTPDPKKR